ncbi:unnamed protein product, partial [Penicillium palitans]
ILHYATVPYLQCTQISINGKQALITHAHKSQERSYSRFPTPIAPTPNFRVQRLAHPIHHHRHLRYQLPQRAVECLHDLKRAVHLRRFDRGRSHLAHPAPTQIKQLAINGGSVRSHLRRPLGDQVASKGQGRAKTTIPSAAPRNSARSGAYLTDSTQHPISADDLIFSLNSQLDEDMDRYIPFGDCGSYGAPFKLTCMEYGYTVIGKGTTVGLWKEVSREAEVYRVLHKAQGSAVPVFLGTIDLAKIYFLHGAQIRHMLVMGWGGECTATMELTQQLHREIYKSNKEIRALGIIHEDLRRENVLWSEELGRALIIDFHRSTLRCRPAKQRWGPAKRRPCRVEAGDAKRLRVS